MKRISLMKLESSVVVDTPQGRVTIYIHQVPDVSEPQTHIMMHPKGVVRIPDGEGWVDDDNYEPGIGRPIAFAENVEILMTVPFFGELNARDEYREQCCPRCGKWRMCQCDYSKDVKRLFKHEKSRKGRK